MHTQNTLRVDEVIDALKELGGEAEWSVIKKLVTTKRGNSYAGYKNKYNFEQTMNQLVQQHCNGYAKFTGRVLFVQTGKSRFRLVLPISASSPRKFILPEVNYPDNVPADQNYIAGAVRQVLVNAYERDPSARRECIVHQGTCCSVCEMSFEQRYGIIGLGFIHVHHKKPLATREVYILDPVKDLTPVCPNCHSMIHSTDPPLSVEELKDKMKLANQSIKSDTCDKNTCA